MDLLFRFLVVFWIHAYVLALLLLLTTLTNLIVFVHAHVHITYEYIDELDELCLVSLIFNVESLSMFQLRRHTHMGSVLMFP